MLKIFQKINRKIEAKTVEYVQKDIKELSKILNGFTTYLLDLNGGYDYITILRDK